MPTSTSGIPIYFYVVTWFLVFLGWFFTNYQNQRATTRKELRDQIGDIHQLLSDVRKIIFDFYFKKENRTEFLKNEILDSLEVIITFITVLQNHSHLSITEIEDAYYSMYAAVTDSESFDSLNKEILVDQNFITNISFNLTNLTIQLEEYFKNNQRLSLRQRTLHLISPNRYSN